MTYKLILSSEGDTQPQKEYVFNKDTVIIGRDLNSDLQLEGGKSVVSRKHAQIKSLETGVQIEDLNSRNSTYVNDMKLKSGVSHELKTGDVIHICDFLIEFRIESHETKYFEQTLLDHPNPFLKHAAQLVSLLSQISQDFDCETQDRKEESLKEAFHDFLSDVSGNNAVRIIAESMYVKTAGMPETHEVEPEIKTDRFPYVEVPSGQSDTLSDLALNLFLKLLQARRQFRMEFIGETMIRSSKTFSIYSCSLDELKEYLYDPGISPAERQNRMDSVKNLSEEIMLHQVSLLDGYKASVNEGTKHFLDKLDPGSVQKKVQEKKLCLGPVKIPYGNFPVLGPANFKKIYKEFYKELAREDQSIIEKKYFRPSYVKRYNKCMDSGAKGAKSQKK